MAYSCTCMSLSSENLTLVLTPSTVLRFSTEWGLENPGSFSNWWRKSASSGVLEKGRGGMLGWSQRREKKNSAWLQTRHSTIGGVLFPVRGETALRRYVFTCKTEMLYKITVNTSTPVWPQCYIYTCINVLHHCHTTIATLTQILDCGAFSPPNIPAQSRRHNTSL